MNTERRLSSATRDTYADARGVDGARTGTSRPPSPPHYQPRYSYILTDHHDGAQFRRSSERGTTERQLSEGSSTERTSVADSLQNVYDPTEERSILPSELLNTEPMDPSRLMTDICRCQNQVEELIALFKSLNGHQGIPAALPESTPRLRQRFVSRIPRRRVETHPRLSLNLEDARANLAQSLEDALKVLEQFPREQQMLHQCITPPNDAPLSHQELLSAVDCLEQISLHASSETTEERSMRSGSVQSVKRSDARIMERLPVLEESLSFSSDPCSTPSGCTNEDYWIHNQADEMLFSQMSPFCSSPKNDLQHRYSSNSDFWDLFPTHLRTQASPYPYRVLFQDPIQLGHLSANSSQSLSGLETACAIRIHAHLERDAMSDSEVLNGNEDVSPICRRTHSAAATVCPYACTEMTHLHQYQPSLDATSDWDLIEGGILVRDERCGLDAVPGRLLPESMPWTSTAFSSLESRSGSCLAHALPPRGPAARLSDFSEKSMESPLEEHHRVDRSVQCDLSSSVGYKPTPRGGRCGFWFKKRNKKHQISFLERLMPPVTFLSRTVEGPEGAATGVLRSLRTVVRAALRPACPHGKRDAACWGSTHGLSGSLYRDSDASSDSDDPYAA